MAGAPGRHAARPRGRDGQGARGFLLYRWRWPAWVVLALLLAGCGATPEHDRDPDGGARSDLERAELALARDENEQASVLFDLALARDPDDPRASLGSARAHLAAGRGLQAVDRFTAYREAGGAWQRTEARDLCRALGLAVDQLLESGRDPVRAEALARQIVDPPCEAQNVDRLWLRTGLALADREREAGRDESALERYRALVELDPRGGEPREKTPLHVAVRYDDPDLARAYLEASRLLLSAGRRDEALAMLSRGLDALPGNRDLVHLMVTVLAEGSNVVFPREKTPENQTPAASPPAPD